MPLSGKDHPDCQRLSWDRAFAGPRGISIRSRAWYRPLKNHPEAAQRMFILKKIVAPFLLPPGLFIVLLFVVAMALRSSKKRGAAFLMGLFAALIWASSTAPAADLAMGGLEAEQAIPADPRGDVIIMLGGAALTGTPDFSGVGAPGGGTLERMVTAARLQRKLKVPIIVSGGKVHEVDESIALVTRRVLIDLGISPEMVIMEDRSRDTYENALYTKEICQSRGYKKPLVVTSAYHMARSRFCFEKVGLGVTPYPCAFQVWKARPRHWTQYLPTSGHLDMVAAALHERLGLLYYRMRY